MIRLVALIGAFMLCAPAAAAPSEADAQIAALNAIDGRYVADPPKGKKVSGLRDTWRWSLDAERTTLRVSLGGHVVVRVPLDMPWRLSTQALSAHPDLHWVWIRTDGKDIARGRYERSTTRFSSWHFEVRSREDAEAAVDALVALQRATTGREPAVRGRPAPAGGGVKPNNPPEPRAKRDAKPVAKRDAKPDAKPEGKPDAKPPTGRRPAYTIAVEQSRGTHDGRFQDISVTVPAGAWVTAFAESGGGMQQVLALVAPDGSLVGGERILDYATGSIRPGFIARARATAGGRYTARVMSKGGKTGPFAFEFRVVRPVGEPDPTGDGCDGLDYIVAHVADGLGHLVDVRKPSLQRVDYVLPELQLSGTTAGGHGWRASHRVRSAAEGAREAASMAKVLTRCLGPSGPAQRRRSDVRRIWRRGEVKVALDAPIEGAKGPQQVWVQVYRGEDPI